MAKQSETPKKSAKPARVAIGHLANSGGGAFLFE